MLRPRYSLLTLLVLTALVAGGVKLWYGPHRVVEQLNSTQEVEYTFTRDWRGGRILEGPYIKRLRWPEEQEVDVEFYRAGNQLTCYYVLTLQEAASARDAPPLKFPDQLGLSPDEQLAWKSAIEREAQQLARSAPDRRQAGIWWHSVLTE